MNHVSNTFELTVKLTQHHKIMHKIRTIATVEDVKIEAMKDVKINPQAFEIFNRDKLIQLPLFVTQQKNFRN